MMMKDSEEQERQRVHQSKICIGCGASTIQTHTLDRLLQCMAMKYRKQEAKDAHRTVSSLKRGA